MEVFLGNATWLVPLTLSVLGFLWLHILLWQINRPMMVAYIISMVLGHLSFLIAFFINFELGVALGVFFGLVCVVTFFGGLFGWEGFGLIASLFGFLFASERSTEPYRNGYSESNHKSMTGGKSW